MQRVCVDWLSTRTRVVECPYRETDRLRGALADAAGLVIGSYTLIDEARLSAASKLRVVGRAGVGLDNVDLEACRRHDVAVVYTPAANTNAVVEYVVALILDDMRPRIAMDAPIDADTFHRWRRERVGTQLDDLALGICGFGRIGRRLGRVAHALGMTVLTHDVLPEADLRPQVDYPFEYVDRPELCRRSDVLSIHVDGRPENRNLIDAAVLSTVRPGCLLINTSRGMVIDGAALADWARSAQGSGGRAALDVHDPEPPPADYALYGLPNVRLLPHIASRTGRALQNMGWVVRDVWAVLEGSEPRYPA